MAQSFGVLSPWSLGSYVRVLWHWLCLEEKVVVVMVKKKSRIPLAPASPSETLASDVSRTLPKQ